MDPAYDDDDDDDVTLPPTHPFLMRDVLCCLLLLTMEVKTFALSHVLGDEELPSSFEESEEKQAAKDKEVNSSSVPVYKWSQDNEDVTVRFQIPDGTTKEKISCQIKADSLDVRVEEDVLLSGDLFGNVISEESTWTFDKNRYCSIMLNNKLRAIIFFKFVDKCCLPQKDYSLATEFKKRAKHQSM